jgi:DNA-binding Lrp family transcriptional regulator
LLSKLDELSTTRGRETSVPGAGGWQGDVADQASSDTEAELQIRLHQTGACWGMPDIFVVAEVGNPEELNKLVIDKIQALEGVERIESHNAIE